MECKVLPRNPNFVASYGCACGAHFNHEKDLLAHVAKQSLPNLRTVIITKAELRNFNAAQFTIRLKEAGFKLDKDICPVKITKPWDTRELPDGGVEWRQWDSVN